MPTCAIYARVSTDKQGESVDNQITLLSAYAAQKGKDWAIDQRYIYRDDGVTGTNIYMRPAVKRMIQEAKQGLFDIVLFKGISRFARDTEDSLRMLRLLLQSNVRVISYEESYDSDRFGKDVFIYTIHSALAEQESQKISLRVKLGMNESVKQGRWVAGNVPFGYILTDEQRLEIKEIDAEVVRIIYNRYVNAGWGTHRICTYLDKNGYRSRRGGKWSKKTILDVLRNRVYTGATIYGRRSFETQYDDEGTGKKKIMIHNDESQWITVPDTHVAIVDEVTFERTQTLLKKRRVTRSRGDAHVLTGILRCAKCGNTFVHKTGSRGYNYYYCKTRLSDGVHACEQKPIPSVQLEREVLEEAQALAANFREQLSTISTKKSDKVDTASALDNQIESIQKQIINANSKNAQGIIDDQTFSFMLKELNGTLNNLMTERAKVVELASKRAQTQTRTLDMMEAINEILSLETLNDEVNRARNRNKLMAIIDYILIDGDRVQIELKRQ